MPLLTNTLAAWATARALSGRVRPTPFRACQLSISSASCCAWTRESHFANSDKSSRTTPAGEPRPRIVLQCITINLTPVVGELPYTACTDSTASRKAASASPAQPLPGDSHRAGSTPIVVEICVRRASTSEDRAIKRQIIRRRISQGHANRLVIFTDFSVACLFGERNERVVYSHSCTNRNRFNRRCVPAIEFSERTMGVDIRNQYAGDKCK